VADSPQFAGPPAAVIAFGVFAVDAKLCRLARTKVALDGRFAVDTATNAGECAL